jgi:hypothetical protein
MYRRRWRDRPRHEDPDVPSIADTVIPHRGESSPVAKLPQKMDIDWQLALSDARQKYPRAPKRIEALLKRWRDAQSHRLTYQLL